MKIQILLIWSLLVIIILGGVTTTFLYAGYKKKVSRVEYLDRQLGITRSAMDTLTKIDVQHSNKGDIERYLATLKEIEYKYVRQERKDYIYITTKSLTFRFDESGKLLSVVIDSK